MDQQTRNHVKALIVEQGLDKQVAKACRQSFANDDRRALDALEDMHGSTIVKIAKAVNTSRYRRKQRIASRLGDFVTLGNCLFLTLTFSDEVLAKTSPQTRRKYVARYLRSVSPAYVANIDYGNDGEKRVYKDAQGVERVSTAREHYHAVAFCPSVDYKPWREYGAIVGKVIHTEGVDAERVSKYVAKLSNHAMKVNDGIAPRMIYSREKRLIKELFRDLF